MSAEIILCHGREYVNTEQGLSLVHDFPNPFSPDSALPAINWKGSWIIITPVASGTPFTTPIMPSTNAIASLKVDPSSLPPPEHIPDDSSLPSPDTPLRDSFIPSPGPEVMEISPPEPESLIQDPLPIVRAPEHVIPDPEPSSRSSSPKTASTEDIKPIVRIATPVMPQPLSNTDIRMRAPSTRPYTTVQSIGEIPRWREVESANTSQSSNRMQSSHNGSYPSRSSYSSSSGRHSPDRDYPPQRNGKRSIYDRDNMSSGRSHGDYRPPSPRRASLDRREVNGRATRSSYSRESSSLNGSNSRDSTRNDERERDRNFGPSSSAPLRSPVPTNSTDTHTRDSLRSTSMRDTVTTPNYSTRATSQSVSLFPPLPAELTDRSELERYVANNAGPPNIGPTITVMVTRDGIPQKDIEVEIATSASVSGLKAKLRAITGMFVREQRLTLGKSVLHPDLKISSLQEEIAEGKTLLLSKRSGEGRIEVETMDGRIHAFECGPSDYVADLEDAVLEKVFNNTERVRFHLLNGGHRLRRPATLNTAGVKAGHKLRLVLSAQS